MQADTTKHAWAAGFIDGEGSISVRRIWNKRLDRYVFQLYLRAAQVELSPLTKLQELYGGPIHIVASTGGNAAPYHSWYLTSGKAAIAIQEMLPYFTLKRERAVVGLEFQLLIKRGRMKKGTEHAQLDLQEVYWHRMHALNLRWYAQAERRAAAETEPSGSQGVRPEGCDSPVCNDSKVAEGGRNDRSLKLAVGGSRSE